MLPKRMLEVAPPLGHAVSGVKVKPPGKKVALGASPKKYCVQK